MGTHSYLQKEPPFSVEDLIKFIGLEYGIKGLRLIRILSGMTAWGYKLSSIDGNQYFVKVIPWNENLEEVNEDILFILSTLVEKTEITQVPQVIRTLKSKMKSKFKVVLLLFLTILMG